MRYQDWLMDWLNNYVGPSVKPKTYERYSDIISKHLIPRLGECQIEELTPIMVQRYITELMQRGNLKTGKGLSPNSVNSVIAVIQGSMETAYTLGLVKEYTMNKIKRPKAQEKQVTCFTLSEQKLLEEAVRKDRRIKMIGVLLCLYTGLRLGELMALEWTDVDLSKAELHVNKTCFYGKNKNGGYRRYINEPKTLSSVRVIPFPKQLLPILREAKKRSQSPYVVADGEEPVSVRSYQRSFELLQKKLKIPRRGFHSLRHTFATRALECGMDVKTLSEILGHKNPTITLNRYVHSLMEHKRDMMNRLGKLL